MNTVSLHLACRSISLLSQIKESDLNSNHRYFEVVGFIFQSRHHLRAIPSQAKYSFHIPFHYLHLVIKIILELLPLHPELTQS